MTHEYLNEIKAQLKQALDDGLWFQDILEATLQVIEEENEESFGDLSESEEEFQEGQRRIREMIAKVRALLPESEINSPH